MIRIKRPAPLNPAPPMLYINGGFVKPKIETKERKKKNKFQR